MAMNRVQFQPGLSIAEFMERYGSNEQCEAALIAARWPGGFICPDCGGQAISYFRREGRQYWQCSVCRHQCSVISGTIFESNKLGLARWFLAMHLLTQSKNNVAAMELMRHLGVCYKTAWLLKHKLMEMMRLREEPRRLTGRVEIDDAYLGGERSGGTAGRGSENKVPFLAAVQTTPDGQPVVACFAKQPFTKEGVSAFMAKSFVSPLTMVSDGLLCFKAAATKAPNIVHQRVVTGSGKAGVKLPEFRAINTVLGNLKNALCGTYHAFDFAKYAHRYLAEAQCRFNRRFDLRTILARFVHAAAVTKPHPAAFIRMAEASH